MKRVFVWISVGLNAVVLAGVGYVALGSPFRDWVHPFLTESSTSFFAAYPIQAGDVVFVGDSITAGAQWNELFPDVRVRNRGIGGDRTEDILARFDPLTAGPASRVFLKIGTNDLGAGIDEATILENYERILDRFEREAPSTTVYVQSVLPRAASYRKLVESLNTEIEALAAARDVEFIDLYPAFLADDGSIRDALSYDELHLTGEGYRLWQEQLAPYVRG